MLGTGENGRENVSVEKIKMRLGMDLRTELRQIEPFCYGYELREERDVGKEAKVGDYLFTERYSRHESMERRARLSLTTWNDFFDGYKDKHFAADTIVKLQNVFLYVNVATLPLYGLLAACVIVAQRTTTPLVLCAMASVATIVMAYGGAWKISQLHKKSKAYFPNILSMHFNARHEFPTAKSLTLRLLAELNREQRNEIAEKLALAVKKSECAFEECTGKKGTLKRMCAGASYFEKEPLLFVLYVMGISAYISLIISACVLYALDLASVGGVLALADLGTIGAFVFALIGIIAPVVHIYTLQEHLKVWKQDDKTFEGDFEFYVPEEQVNEPKNTQEERSGGEEARSEYSQEAASSAMCDVVVDLGLENVPVFPVFPTELMV